MSSKDKLATLLDPRTNSCAHLQGRRDFNIADAKNLLMRGYVESKSGVCELRHMRILLQGRSNTGKVWLPAHHGDSIEGNDVRIPGL